MRIIRKIIKALGNDYNIHTFINLIFKKLTEKLKNSVNLKSNKEREEFEAQIEIIVEEAFKEYPRAQKEYKKFENEKNLDKDDLEALLLEIHNPDIYNQSDYPFYKLFLMPEYSIKGIFFELQKIPDYENKYPILTHLLNKNKKDIFLLEYLNDFNIFANDMIKNFSYQISREDATKIKFKDSKKASKLNINRFKEIWVELKPYIKQYGCHNVYPLDLDENYGLCYFLNDYTEYNEDGKYSKGICIAAAYEKFIEWQNKMFDILELKLNKYIQYIPEKKEIQNVQKDEILNFKEVNLISIFYQNNKRNIFDDNGKIKYYNYKNILYDFENIEKEIGKIFFRKKKS